jgi:lipopolysaccharide transport system permease protein
MSWNNGEAVGATIEVNGGDVPPGEDRPAPPAAADPEVAEVLIESRPGWQVLDLRELWRYRELLYFLSWRDIKLRYKQTALGAAWALIQPLATMAVFTLFLRPTGEGAMGAGDYALFVYAGLVPWLFFANAVTSAAQSIITNQNLVTKVYFPRLMIPGSAVLAQAPDFVIGTALLLVLMVFYPVAPGPGMVLALPVLLALVVAAVGVGALLSALNVAYRDFRYVVPFLVQIWMFATPSIYRSRRLLDPSHWDWGWVLALNPVYGTVAAFRQALFGEAIDWYALGVSAAVGIGLFVAGCLYFRRVERSFADII